MCKKLVVFDLDGTLNQTENYAAPAMLAALRDMGITRFTNEDVLRTFGARDEDTNILFFGERAEECKDAYWKKVDSYIETDYRHCFRPFEGTLEMLRELKSRGFLLAVCSNAFMGYIGKITSRIGIAQEFDYFQPLVEGLTKVETLGLLLAEVKPDKAFMVGDRYFDMEAAQRNRIPFVACRFGYAAPKELDGADYTIDHPMELVAIVSGE